MVRFALWEEKQSAKVIDFYNRVLPKWSRTFIELSEFGEFKESNKTRKYNMGVMITPWSLTQGVAGLNNRFVNIFITEFN